MPSVNQLIDAEDKVFCCQEYLTFEHLAHQKKWILTTWRKFEILLQFYLIIIIKIMNIRFKL